MRRARHRRRQPWTGAALVGAGVLAGIGGVVVLTTSPSPSAVTADFGAVLDDRAAPEEAPAEDGPPSSTVRLLPSTSGPGQGLTEPEPEPASFVPARLLIDAVGIDAPLIATTVGGDGVFVPPDDPNELGWWSGVRPGGGAGSVLVAGHLDARRYGQGPLARIVDLDVGDRATVTGPDTTRTYVVRGMSTFPKDELPADELFGVDGPERLVLVTCGGTFSRTAGHWDSNVVAVLDPVAAG